jgi:catechol 2,3-dioxygenase-like lactoylglutathione lyase family enzyme
MKGWIPERLKKFNFFDVAFLQFHQFIKKHLCKKIMKLNQFQKISIVIVLFSVAIKMNTFCQNNFERTNETMKNNMDNSVWVRYIVNDVKESVDFYTKILGFKVEIQPPSGGFAQMSLDNLKLLINKPGAGGAGKTLSDKSVPMPGGWNRIQIRVANLEQRINDIKSQNVQFRNELVKGNGGMQILLLDPSGNLIELFEPYK